MTNADKAKKLKTRKTIIIKQQAKKCKQELFNFLCKIKA